MEKPILFNIEMVKAILEGRKNTTRRVLKQPFEIHPNGFITKGKGNERLIPYEAPYEIGDILYVRETWCDRWLPDGFLQGKDRYGYKADGIPSYGYWGNENQCKDNVWIPSIHMPKEAARMFLKVTNVRVERLQDIDYDNLISEGTKIPRFATEETLKVNFKNLWDSTLKKDLVKVYSWDTNPYVWVIQFEVIER